MSEWIEANETLLTWLGVGSVITFFGSLIVVPLLIARMPADYFLRQRKPFRSLSPIRIVGRIAKNFCGLLLLVAGFAMLFLPGQGILTILIGITLIDFPNKRELETRIVRNRGVRSSVNWLRKRARKPPLDIPERKISQKSPNG